MTTEHSCTIVGQIIGGLALELDKKLPQCNVILGSIHGEPAVKVDQVWVVLDQDKLKVILAAEDANPSQIRNNPQRYVRRVLFSCSISRPDDDFEDLYDFFRRYETDFDKPDYDGYSPVPPLREDGTWINARSADNS